MPKTAGLGDNFYVDGVDVSGDTQAINNIHGGPAALDMTAISNLGFARQGGERDGGLSWISYFNPGAGLTHAKLSALPTADVICSYFQGHAVGNESASLVGKQANYDPNRGQDGSMVFTLEAQSNGFGLEWGTQHTAGIQTDVAATNSAGMDGLAQTAFGAQLYVHFFSVVGTSCTVKIQDFTSDTPASYTDVTGLTTTAVTPGQAPQAQRIQLAGNAVLRRWTRVATVGTFTSCAFAVVLVRNLTAVSF